MKDKPRIGECDWIHARPDVTAVFNGAYGTDGTLLGGAGNKPWTVMRPDGVWEHFQTHAEAVNYAFQEAEKTA